MDPVSHAALGRSLVALAGDGRGSRPAVVAATLGALSPDIDAVLMPFGWDRYLRVHEIGTHTLAGLIACGLLTALVVRPFGRGASCRALAGAGCLGAASHVLLDLLSSARLRIFWPIVDAQLSLPLVAMADPWLAAVLIAGAAAIWVSRARRRVAAIALAAAAAFLLVKSAVALRAIDSYGESAQRGSGVRAAVVEAKWASLTEWNVFDRTADQLRFWKTDGARRRARLAFTWPLAPESEEVAASRSLQAVRNFLRGHDLAFAATLPQPDGGRSVLWSDIRFCWNPAGAGAPQLEPTISRDGATIACALWFGGEYDRRGTLLHEIVKIGGFTQTRPPGS